MSITKAQQNVIDTINKNLGIEFKGKTKDDARFFIKRHIERSKREHQRKMFEDDAGWAGMPNQ